MLDDFGPTALQLSHIAYDGKHREFMYPYGEDQVPLRIFKN